MPIEVMIIRNQLLNRQILNSHTGSLLKNSVGMRTGARSRLGFVQCTRHSGGTAQAGETITYSEIAQAANTDNRRYTSKLLDGISHIEEHHGRPPLSVLVVNADSGRPSEAFMVVVDRYSLRNRYDASSSEALIQAMTADVHRTWES